MARVQTLSTNNILGILIIDEQEPKDEIETLQVAEHVRAQQTFLVFAQHYNCKFWILDLPVSKGFMVRVKGLLPPETPYIIKPRYNAFDGTPLLQDLYQEGVTRYLIVMGHAANCCVMQTALGGCYNPRNNDPFVSGAVGHGFIVLSCDQILSAGPANWKTAVNIEFYSNL